MRDSRQRRADARQSEADSDGWSLFGERLPTHGECVFAFSIPSASMSAVKLRRLTQPVDALAHERTMDMSAHLRGGHPSLAWSGVLDFGGVAPTGSHLSPAKEDKAAIERKNLEIEQRQKARQALEKQINEHLSEALAQLHEIEKKDLIEYILYSPHLFQMLVKLHLQGFHLL